MGGGPANADVVRSSCFVTFPAHAHAEPVPVDAWYLYAAGLTFLRRLSRDRVGEEMHIALLLQVVVDNDDDDDNDEYKERRRYVSVSSNAVLQQALEATFDCPAKALLLLHVIDVGKVRDQKRIHVRPQVNPNVSPEPVEPMGLMFPILSVHGVVAAAAPTAVEVPAAQVSSARVSDHTNHRPLMDKYRTQDGARWTGEEKVEKAHDLKNKNWSSSAFFVEERDYTRRDTRQEQPQPQPQKVDERRQKAGVPVAVEAIGDLFPPAKQVQVESDYGEQEHESNIPVATVVDADAAHIPCDYVMLELQTGAGLPEVPATASSTYFISSRWAEQADEMSASMRLARLPLARSTRVRAVSSIDIVSTPATTLDDSFVVLERQDL